MKLEDNQLPFTVYWRDGKREIICGPSITQAFTQAGIGHGAISAVDWYAVGATDTHRWNPNSRAWEPRRPFIQVGPLTEAFIEELPFHLTRNHEITHVFSGSNHQMSVRQFYWPVGPSSKDFAQGVAKVIRVQFEKYMGLDEADEETFQGLNTKFFDPKQADLALAYFVEVVRHYEVTRSLEPIEAAGAVELSDLIERQDVLE